MAAVSPAADQTTGLLKKLSIDSQTKTDDVPDVAKKPPAIKYGTADGGEVVNTPIYSCERSMTPILQDFMDPSMCYLPNGYSPAYCYGAYDAHMNEWEDYSRYMNPDGVEMPPTGVYGDIYHGYGYAPYGAYPPGSPVPTMGHDGQLYGPQQYQYPGPYYQQPAPASSPFTPNQVPTSQGEVSTPVGAEQPSLPSDSAKGNSNGTTNGDANRNTGSTPLRPSNHNSSLTSNGLYVNGVFPSGLPSSYPDPRFGFDGMRSPVPWLDGPAFPDGQHRLSTNSSASSAVSRVGNISSARNQNLHPLPHLMGFNPARPTSGMTPAAPGFMNRMYPDNRMYVQCGNAYRTGLGFGSNGYDSRTNGRGWLSADSKYKPRNRGNGFYGYGNESPEGLNELNRGPRSGRFRNQKGVVPNVTIAVKGQPLSSNGNNEESSIVPDRDQYNRTDFPEKHSGATFFVIKSYSEDDIHKSIKYSVWASTPNGNKKLDAGYKEAQETAGGCPVFLFFSVNTSGQFVGVAEMVGPVDFNKTVDYWQQDKWNGCFPVKWHIVKDVPNSMLKHITLENNENKPVTNSRDTQEVKFEQGLQMLKLFKDHVSKTSILEDFGFYETRQKTMQEKRAKQRQFQKQVWDGKPTGAATEEKDKEQTNGKLRLQKLSASVVNKEAVQGGGPGESELSEENGSTAKAGEAPKVAKPVTEKRVVILNGVANGHGS